MRTSTARAGLSALATEGIAPHPCRPVKIGSGRPGHSCSRRLAVLAYRTHRHGGARDLQQKGRSRVAQPPRRWRRPCLPDLQRPRWRPLLVDRACCALHHHCGTKAIASSNFRQRRRRPARPYAPSRRPRCTLGRRGRGGRTAAARRQKWSDSCRLQARCAGMARAPARRPP